MNIYYEDVAKHSMAVRAWDYVIDFVRDHMELSLLTRSQVLNLISLKLNIKYLMNFGKKKNSMRKVLNLSKKIVYKLLKV